MNRKFKVIVADDEKLIAENIARKITQLNGRFEIAAVAGTGLQAWELCADLLPDVVFSDIKMPELDGIGLIERLHARFPDVLTVIVSGYNDFAYARAAIQYGVTDYLLKPVNPDELAQVLSQMERMLLSRAGELQPGRGASPAEIVAGVTGYLRENYAAQIDFAAIAASHYVSASYLSRIFHDRVGVSPIRYLTDLRMKNARRLLADTDLSVREIAELVGYTDPFYFSKAFKAAAGVNPTQFREGQG